MRMKRRPSLDERGQISQPPPLWRVGCSDRGAGLPNDRAPAHCGCGRLVGSDGVQAAHQRDRSLPPMHAVSGVAEAGQELKMSV